jgi:hypothetical protein
LILLLVSLVVAAAPPNHECAGCHPAETKLHAATHMAHAMEPGLSSLFARHLPDQPLRESADGFGFAYRRMEDGLEVTAQRDDASASGVIEWVLGSGVQGQTPIVRVGASMLESRVSYYPRLDRFGITIGQPAGRSPNAGAALGLKQSKRDAISCLLCHSSAVTKDLEPEVPGVQCERCHAGATEHARTKGPKGPVSNPGKLSAVGQLQICGACHRLTPPVDDTQLENVRFQPLRLMKSRCFASGKVACTTCHVAHQDAKRSDPGFYNEKCAACHAAGHTDKRKNGNCIDCHMPVVQLHPALEFTDHYIRVVR